MSRYACLATATAMAVGFAVPSFAQNVTPAVFPAEPMAQPAAAAAIRPSGTTVTRVPSCGCRRSDWLRPFQASRDCRVLDAVLRERDVAADVVKVYYGRLRPWTFSDNIQVCEAAGKNGSKVRSYPSGHGTLAYAPGHRSGPSDADKGQTIMARAEDSL